MRGRADLADQPGPGPQGFLHRPERIADILGLGENDLVRAQTPGFQAQRIGAAEILPALPGRADPNQGRTFFSLLDMRRHEAGLHSQSRRRVEIIGRADLMQASLQMQCIGWLGTWLCALRGLELPGKRMGLDSPDFGAQPVQLRRPFRAWGRRSHSSSLLDVLLMFSFQRKESRPESCPLGGCVFPGLISRACAVVMRLENWNGGSCKRCSNSSRPL